VDSAKAKGVIDLELLLAKQLVHG